MVGAPQGGLRRPLWAGLGEGDDDSSPQAEDRTPTKAKEPAVESFDDFLTAAGLQNEKALFLENGFDSVQMLLEMSEDRDEMRLG